MNKNSKFQSRLIEKVNLIPILFSTPMVKAIINGKKTLTRRVVKPQPIVDEHQTIHEVAKGDFWVGQLHNFPNVTHFSGHSSTRFKCPYGKPGDILWVRETWAYIGDVNEINPFVYKANVCSPEFDKPVKGWKPSIHMPFDVCRLFLRIKSVRVERLNLISEEDAKAEGIELDYNDRNPYSGMYKDYTNNSSTCHSALCSFMTLWQSINGIDSWGSQWVWVIEFERVNEQDILLPF